MRRTITVYLAVQATSIELARYIKKNIDNINNNGISINIEKIVDSNVLSGKLQSKGITRLPAIEQPNGKIIIGISQIIDSFKSVAETLRSEKFEPIGANDELVSNHWRNELFTFNPDTGKYEGREDSDKKEDDFGAIERRMREYEMNMPAHRRSGGKERRGGRGGDDDDDHNYGRDGRNDRRNMDGEDNIDDRNSYTPNTNNFTSNFIPSDDAHGDELDAKMLAAWTNNNPTGDE